MSFTQKPKVSDLIFNNISYDIEKFKDHIKNEISRIKYESYREGLKNGFKQGFEIGCSNVDITDIDYNSIKKFAEWCYIHGIDFSYMAKSTDTAPFINSVIDNFKDEIEKDMNRNDKKEENN